MNKTSVILTMLFFPFIAVTQVQEHSYSDSSLTCIYHTSQGRIDGKYISYYKNGKKKAEGSFRNNYRHGDWSVWDSAGKLCVKRNYSDPFTFERIYPELPSDKSIQLLNVPRYKLLYNKDGYIDYFPMQERMVVWSKRLWRYLPAENNPILFKNDTLIKIILKNIFSGNITAYSTADDEFLNPLKPEDVDTSNLNIIAYKIKEDCFIDNDRLVAESRIIGFCPVALDTVEHFKKKLFWLYFPEMRKVLASVKISDKMLPDEIKSFDDLFFFRYFSTTIYKESNVYDREISDFKFGVDIDKEAERIEIDMIETEHDMWKSFAK